MASSAKCFRDKTRQAYGPDIYIYRKETHAIVLINQVPDIQLTRIYRHIASEKSAPVALACIGLLHAITRLLPKGLLAPDREIQESFDLLVKERYHTNIDRRRATQITAHCMIAARPTTVQTVFQRLRTAFNTLIKMGIRSSSPMELMPAPRLPPGPNRYRRWTGQRPLTYYVIKAGPRQQELDIIRNAALPDQLRTAADQAGWKIREMVILTGLLAFGARVSELVEMRWDSLAAGTPDTLVLRIKGSSGQPQRVVELNQQVKRLLLDYLSDERVKHDPEAGAYARFRQGKPWSIKSYTDFLLLKGRDLNEVPVFLTARQTAYTVATFRRHYWTKLSKTPTGLIIRPHQIRHWYINQRLAQIVDSKDLEEWERVGKIQDLVKRMCWKNWRALVHYDHFGVVEDLMTRYDQKFSKQMNQRPATHGRGQNGDDRSTLGRTKELGILPPSTEGDS